MIDIYNIIHGIEKVGGKNFPPLPVTGLPGNLVTLAGGSRKVSGSGVMVTLLYVMSLT